MNPWIWRAIIIILASAFVPVIISGVAALVTSGIHGISQGIHSLVSPLSMSGDARLEGVIRLCLYLLAAALIIKSLLGKK